MPQTVEIIAHRGLPRTVTENTLESFALAIARGADAIELDVHATADGIVVVHHDPVLADGTAIDATPWNELAGRRLPGELRVPRLADVLAAAAGVTTYVEVKGEAIERLVADAVRAAPGRVAVHAFDHRVPAVVGAQVAGLRRGILQASYLVDSAHALRAAGAADLWQHTPFIDRALVDAASAANARVVAWTVNTPDEARRLVDLGVTALCTDHCDQIRDWLS